MVGVRGLVAAMGMRLQGAHCGCRSRRVEQGFKRQGEADLCRAWTRKDRAALRLIDLAEAASGEQ